MSLQTSPPLPLALFLLLVSTPLISARTDLTGCTTTDVSSPAGASVAWYVPGTGELCDFLDCGGGAGAPRYDVPGCPMYTGTSTYSPSYLAGYQAAATSAAAPATSVSATTTLAASAHTEVSQSALSVDAPVTSSSSGFDTTGLVTGTGSSSGTVAVGSASRPAICAVQASGGSDCGVSLSTTTYSGSASAVTQSGSGSASSSGSVSGSVSRTVSRTTSTAGATGSGSGSASAGAATGTSTGAAAGMTGVLGGVGFVAVALGAVVAL